MIRICNFIFIIKSARRSKVHNFAYENIHLHKNRCIQTHAHIYTINTCIYVWKYVFLSAMVGMRWRCASAGSYWICYVRKVLLVRSAALNVISMPTTATTHGLAKSLAIVGIELKKIQNITITFELAAMLCACSVWQ